MTGAVIKPLVFPALPDGGRPTGAPAGPQSGRRTLPLPVVPTPRTSTVVYGLAAVDCRGRVAHHAVITALGWLPGIRLDIHESCGLLVLRPDAQGVFSVTNEGHLRLPAAVRHCCGPIPGDRVLLAADPGRDVLIVHPPAVLDALLAPRHAELDAARLLLARMGVSAEDLLTAPASRPPVPTFAEYIPTVSAAVTDGTRRVYGPLLEPHRRALGPPSPGRADTAGDQAAGGVDASSEGAGESPLGGTTQTIITLIGLG
ncbi:MULTISPECIES: hypothetical protein [Amycolatopsis]|uniref:SpoVT-AbrB domain-containing protein n=1 Tax=Amycolatopsis bullii TaxID=941987 RepID=A0ABQ3KP39_9PSEU|nr:hypothetical protein [Amycolatopsis bullii]GHG41760.1 hypothetical protein GCM10017567_74340 [Amycolatopsis bullii]